MSANTEIQNAVDVSKAQAELDDLQRALNAVPAILNEVNDLKSHINDIESQSASDETLEDIQDNISEIEQELQSINTVSQSRIQNIENQQEELHSRIEELESDQDEEPKSRIETLEGRVETLESLFTPDVLGKQQAHNEAQRGSVDQVLTVGETRKVIVEETLLDQPEPQFKTTIRGVVTFVDVENRDLEKGDTIEIRICDLRDTAACAKPVNYFE
jgi:hypothetical protein